jgi:hypothetical protein
MSIPSSRYRVRASSREEELLHDGKAVPGIVPGAYTFAKTV